MDTSTDLFLGKVIHGYRLKQLLGRGALTAVYHACAEEEGTVDTLIATLLLVPQTLSSQSKERFKARFFQIAKQLEALHHPSICPFYGYGELDGHCYLLSPNTNGKTLSMHMAQKKSWTSQETLDLLIPIADALEYLHSQGIICQFFSPANVLLLENHEDSRSSIQLTAIGFLPMLRMKGLVEYDLAPYEYLKSVTGSYLGNPEYLAPEIVKGMEGDTSTDVYSLGILLFVLLSGSPPFTGENYLEIAKKHVYETLPSLHDYAPDLPVSLELVINHALYRHPGVRFQNPSEFVTAYVHMINERINVAQNLNIVKKIQQTYKMAAIEPRLLPPGAKRTVEVRSLSSPSIESDSYTTPQEEQIVLPPAVSCDEVRGEKNEEKSGKDVTGFLSEESVAEKSGAEIVGDSIPSLEKTEETPLAGALAPKMTKISNYIHMFTSELSGLASRFAFSRVAAHKSLRARMKKPDVEEKLDHTKEHKHDHSRQENGDEETKRAEDRGEEKGKDLLDAVREGEEQKPDLSSKEKREDTSSKKENVKRTKIEEGSSNLDTRSLLVSHPVFVQHEAMNKEMAREIAQSNTLVPEFEEFHNEKALEKKAPEKKTLEIDQRVIAFETIRTREANVEITTMINQIQQLRERLQIQVKDYKQEHLSSRNDGKKAKDSEQSVKTEEFPEWLN